MNITLTVTDATPEFADRLASLLAPYAADLTVQTEPDTTWTPARISFYYGALPPRAQRIVEEACARDDGRVNSGDLRGDDGEGSLKGHSTALTRVFKRGVYEGWWPAGISAPIEALGPGYGKVLGYTVPEAHLDVFRDTVLSLPNSRRAVLGDQITQRGSTVRWDAALASEVLGAHGLDTDHKGARAILRHLADTGLIVKVDPNRAIYRLATES